MLAASHALSRVVRSTPSAARAMATAALDASKLQVTLTSSPKDKVPNEKLQFGHTFTDHMLEIDWTRGEGWAAPQIIPYGPLQIDPAASVLHYGMECFEGMKAYKDASGTIRLFRPDMNMKRISRSMERLGFPALDGEQMIECMKRLLTLDSDWIPSEDGYSIYLRPTVIGTHPYLGVSRSDQVKAFVIASPVGPYFPSGFKPVSLFADTKNVRAWPGGLGDCKVGGNYAPTIRPQQEASEAGYAQVLWLFNDGDGDCATEVGTMNLFAFLRNSAGEDELVTPPLDGTILPGVTRDSVLALAREWGEFKVSERKLTMKELTGAAEEGRLHECFGVGTAVVVAPLNGFSYKGKEYAVPLDKDDPTATAGRLTQRFWNTITGIQYGKIEHEWSVRV